MLNKKTPTIDNLSSAGAVPYTNIYVPQFANTKVFVLGGAMYGSVVRMLAWAGCEKAENVDEADIVVFIGGSDVDPSLYEEEKIDEVKYTDKERDAFETEIFIECVMKEKIMFGICRGAQFLHVMNGGKLWQHVENHSGKPHNIYDIEADVFVEATSLHHQMLRVNDDMELIAICDEQVSKKFKSEDLFIDLEKKEANQKDEIEVEACSYPATRCFLVQGHPEVGSDEYRSWTLDKLFEFMIDMEEEDFFDNTKEKQGVTA